MQVPIITKRNLNLITKNLQKANKILSPHRRVINRDTISTKFPKYIIQSFEEPTLGNPKNGLTHILYKIDGDFTDFKNKPKGAHTPLRNSTESPKAYDSNTSYILTPLQAWRKDKAQTQYYGIQPKPIGLGEEADVYELVKSETLNEPLPSHMSEYFPTEQVLKLTQETRPQLVKRLGASQVPKVMARKRAAQVLLDEPIQPNKPGSDSIRETLKKQNVDVLPLDSWQESKPNKLLPKTYAYTQSYIPQIYPDAKPVQSLPEFYHADIYKDLKRNYVETLETLPHVTQNPTVNHKTLTGDLHTENVYKLHTKLILPDIAGFYHPNDPESKNIGAFDSLYRAYVPRD
jgi:hypothetical protein